ncbi:MAG: beta-N-acetylhexosaminidase [Terracidiphilus sp.]
MTATVRQAAGSLLVVGLGANELTAMERAWLKLVRPGGVILFKRNIVDPVQTRTLLHEATGLCAPHGARCVDVEGGTVNRLREALADLPSARAVASVARKLHRPQLAREHGELIARAVKAFGFNTTLAPVLDLGLPEAEEVMGSRTAGADPAEVTAYARPFFAGLTAHGVAGCGKHFPGLGGGINDSHFVTPQIKRTWQLLWNQDLVPYRDLREAMPMIMINHAAYPATPGKNRPASASGFWVTTVLRKRIGYRGIILSDDLEMGGILKFLPVEKAAVAAVSTGSDLLLICHSPELIVRSYEAMIAAGERSAVFRKLLLKRANDVERKRQRLFARRGSRPLAARELSALRDRMLRFREMISTSEVDTIGPRTTAPAETS